jgi:hypothetical protein
MIPNGNSHVPSHLQPLLAEARTQIVKCLPRHLDADKMIYVALETVRADSFLRQWEPPQRYVLATARWGSKKNRGPFRLSLTRSAGRPQRPGGPLRPTNHRSASPSGERNRSRRTGRPLSQHLRTVARRPAPKPRARLTARTARRPFKALWAHLNPTPPAARFGARPRVSSMWCSRWTATARWHPIPGRRLSRPRDR